MYCKYCNKEFKTFRDQIRHVCKNKENKDMEKKWKYKKLGVEKGKDRIIEWRKIL